MSGRSVSEAILAADKTATPGPWEPGHIWGMAGVMPERYGDGRCAYCERNGEPVWVGHTNINGRRMLAHRHRYAEPFSTDHVLSGADGSEVAGNYDYEEGGIIDPRDTAFIALARTAAPQTARHALALADALNSLLATEELPPDHNCGCAHCIARLSAREALAAFDTADSDTT